MDDVGPEKHVRVRFCAGAAELTTAGGTTRVDRRASCAIAYLALAGPTSRARMADLLWPDRDGRRARANLRQLVHRTRRYGDLLGGEPLRLGAGVVIEGAWGGATGAPDAAAIPRPGHERAGHPDPFALPDAADLPDLDEWFAAERERRRATVLAQAGGEWESARREGRWSDAVAAAMRRLAADPRSEAAYADLMWAQLEAGDPRAATLSYGRCREMLIRSFGVSPAPRTTTLAERAATMAATAARRASASSAAVAGTDAERLPSRVARRAEARGWMSEGAAILRVTVATHREAAGHAPVPRQAAERGRLLVDLAWLEHQLGRNDAAHAAAREGVELLAPTGADAEGRFVLGSIARHRGDRQRAREHFETALARGRTRTGDAGRLFLHLNLALVADSLEDAATAREQYLAALDLAHALGDVAAEATVLNNLAHALLEREDAAAARVLLQRARAMAHSLEDRHLEAHALDGLARAEAAIGSPRAARALASLAHAMASDVGDVVLRVESLMTLAHVRGLLEGAQVARRLTREALRLAWRHGYLPGVFDAGLALVERSGSEDACAASLLNAVLGDARAPASRVRRARALAAARTLAPTPVPLEAAVAAALVTHP